MVEMHIIEVDYRPIAVCECVSLVRDNNYLVVVKAAVVC